jgi:hypothetical protein
MHWPQEVGSVYAELPETIVLIDPQVPPDEAERFWGALDRDVERRRLRDDGGVGLERARERRVEEVVDHHVREGRGGGVRRPLRVGEREQLVAPELDRGGGHRRRG